MDGESAKLFASYLDGDDKAATVIFDKYVRRLIALASTRLSENMRRRVDAEDIVQSAYRSFFRRADKGEIVVQRSGDLWRILAVFTVNKVKGCVEHHLAQKRHPASEENETIFEALEREPTPDEAVALVDVLESYMSDLTPRDRCIFKMRLEGESIPAIANAIGRTHGEQAGVSEATIRRVLRVVKTDLRNRLFAT